MIAKMQKERRGKGEKRRREKETLTTTPGLWAETYPSSL